MTDAAFVESSFHDESVADNLAGMGAFLIDPAGAARRIFHRWFWIAPWILMAVVAMVSSYFTLPIVQHVLEITATTPGSDPAAAQKGAQMALKVGHIMMYVAPFTTLLFFALEAAILFGTAAVLSIRATFLQMLNLIAGCSIIQTLAALASLLIIRMKADISTMAELRPALGLDIFMPEGANRILVALIGYFSVFEIWWLVMATLVLSAAYRVPKGKAFAVLSPIVIISLTFRVIGAVLARR